MASTLSWPSSVGWAKAAETSADWRGLCPAVPTRSCRTRGHGGAGLVQYTQGSAAFAHPTSLAPSTSHVGWAKAAETSADWRGLCPAVPTRSCRTRGHGGVGLVQYMK